MIKRMLLLAVSLCLLFSMIIGTVLVPSSLHADSGGGLPPPPDPPGNGSSTDVGDSTIALIEEPSNEELSLLDLALLYFVLIL